MTLDQFTNCYTPEPFSGCWLWIKGQRSGYGQAYKANHTIYAHRLSWEIFRGEIPNKAHVLHRCDTPLCVNPDHLFLGTHADNMRDRDAKGKQPAGERNGRARLNSGQISEIRSSNQSCRKLAVIYAVSPSHIASIKSRKRWKFEITQNP